MNKVFSKLLATTLVASTLVGCVPIEAKSSKVKSPIMSVKELTMIPQEKYDININNKISNSTYKWNTSNKSVVKVNAKNGKIEALKVGKSTIGCTIKTKSKTYKLSAKVTVKDKAPFFQGDNRIMPHALGGMTYMNEETGKTEYYAYSNCLEGLQQTLDRGYKFIETDLILTSDNQLVAMHNWDEKSYINVGIERDNNNPVMTREQFLNTKIQGKYTTIDVTTIINAMKDNNDLLFELDLRTLDGDTATKTAKAIVKAFGKDKSLTDRLLVQVGSEEMHKAINKVYNFKYYQYFIHKAELKDIDTVIKYCKDNDIVSVAIKYDYLTDALLQKFKENGISVLVHTVDDSKIAKEWVDKGVDMICTNFLSNEDIQ